MLIEKFLQYIKYERACSSHTFVSYQADLNLLKTFAENKKGGFNPKEITAQDIREWVMQMMEGGTSARSVARRLSTLRSFFKYLLKEGEITTDPMKKVKVPKIPKRLPVFLREGQMDELLSDLEEEVSADAGYDIKRDRLIIKMFYSLGVRVSELINIKDKDVDFDRNAITVTGKRNKQRQIPFGNSLKSDILAFRTARDAELENSKSDYLIVDAKGEQLTRWKVYSIVKKYLSMVSTQSKKSPHVLRHTFATAMLNNGADIDAVKELLGHANLAATEVYTHTTFDRLQKIYKQAHPRA